MPTYGCTQRIIDLGLFFSLTANIVYCAAQGNRGTQGQGEERCKARDDAVQED